MPKKSDKSDKGRKKKKSREKAHNALALVVSESSQKNDEQERTAENKAAMIVALSNCWGVVKYACNMVGISRSTHYEWMADDSEYNRAVKMVKEDSIDEMTMKLIENANGVAAVKETEKHGRIVYEVLPNQRAIEFYLECQGKRLGWVRRQEIVDGRVLPPPPKVDEKMSKEELDAILHEAYYGSDD